MNPVKDRQLDDHISFLKRAEIFEALGSDHLWIVLRHGSIESYTTPGAILFQLGDPADVLYVVKSGVVEICRARGEGETPSVVAYLGEGDTIGEMAITTGTPRGSLARIPQMAEVFKLSKSSFDSLMQKIPEFSNSILSVMSRRLEDRLRKQRMAARYQKLSGDLQYFDLATVIQALAGAGRSGTLTIRNSAGSNFAEIYFDLGRIRYAKLEHLKGKQAVYQLFLAPPQQSFVFESGSLPADFSDEEEIMASTTGLLMECVHLMDELRELKSEITDDQHRFELNMKTLTWEDPDTMALARQIHQRLQNNDTIAQLVRRIPHNEAEIYMVLSEMQHKGLIR
ncbi:MAG: cyclic nucleotide-binding domain-containing protein [Desulfobacterales bacterium]|nr:MAG: cyclic nucleotide-binding domain-containing protein [Desulfobacterales bacterium]